MTNATPTPETFDLAEVLAGRTYPTDTVSLIFDESAMYEFSKLCKRADNDPANEELENERVKMLETFKDQIITVTIQGVDPGVVRAATSEINKEFPIKTNMLGQPLPDMERGEAFSVRMWGLYIVKIENAKGATTPVLPETLAVLRDKAPEAAIEAIDEAIRAMRDGAEKGYEETTRDLAFLSNR